MSEEVCVCKSRVGAELDARWHGEKRAGEGLVRQGRRLSVIERLGVERHEVGASLDAP